MSVTGWQVNGTYIPCTECGYMPPPDNDNLPGVAWRDTTTWHFNNCPTVPNLSPEAAECLQRTLDEMEGKWWGGGDTETRQKLSEESTENLEKGVSGFKPDIIIKMREAAAQDGMTVSGWVRYLVRKELERRGALR